MAEQGPSRNVIESLEDLEQYPVRLGEHELPTRSEAPAAGTDGFFYVPEFISPDEEQYLIQKINDAPQPKWKTLQNRRLQYWGGQVSSKNTLIPQAQPDFFVKFPPLISRLRQTGAFTGSAHGEPNHCLVNEYLAGQGIMPHEDGDAYFPAVATISLASHTMLDIYRWTGDTDGGDDENSGADSSAVSSSVVKSKVRAREQEPIFSILQEPRSLLVTVGSAYRRFLHGIAERTREERPHLCKVINTPLIVDPELRGAVEAAIQDRDQGKMDRVDDVVMRETRISLTFRDVERVSKGLGGLLNKR